MARARVVDPQGNQWKVRRRWAHRRLRWRGPGRGTFDVLDGADLLANAADLPVVGVVITVVVVLVVAVVAVVLIIPALIFVVELLLVLAIVGIGLLGRVLFGRPWTVEASRQGGTGEAFEWKTSGWRASGDLVRTVAEQLRTTGRPDGGVPVAPAPA